MAQFSTIRLYVSSGIGFWDQQYDCYKDKPLVDLLTGK